MVTHVHHALNHSQSKVLHQKRYYGRNHSLRLHRLPHDPVCVRIARLHHDLLLPEVPFAGRRPAVEALTTYPVVTVQLPVFNELYVVGRLIDAACAMIYPKEKLEIQVLDDSTDGTVDVVAQYVERYANSGLTSSRCTAQTGRGIKPGALKEGLTNARGEFVAIFDADFVPRPDFLLKTIPHFNADPRIGMVQTRWEHLNCGLLAADTHPGHGARRALCHRAGRSQQGRLLHQLQRHGRRVAQGMYLRRRATGRPIR